MATAELFCGAALSVCTRQVCRMNKAEDFSNALGE